MKAVVLAAGQGVRLWPLTESRPKPMIPIGGRPIISYIIESLKKNGVTDVLVVVGYRKETIQNYLGDGRRFGLHVDYVIQPKIAGTADAVRIIEKYVGSKNFLVVYGDQWISPKAVETLLTVHETYRDDFVLALVPADRPEFYGVVSVEGSSVKGIIEKPSLNDLKGNLVNAGLYIMKPEIFSAIQKTRKSKRGELEVTDSLQYLIQQGADVRAAQIDPESWIEIGRPWELLEANQHVLRLCEHRIDGIVEKGASVIPPVVMSKGARVETGSVVIGPTIVEEGSDLGPDCRIRPFTSIGKNVKIGPSCEVKNSIVMDGTKVPHLTYVGDSVIGERCNFGAGTNVANLRLDDATVRTPIRDRMVDSGRRKLGVFIGDDVSTGINASLMPGVKIGSRSWIGPGLVLGKDVPEDTLVLLKQQLIISKKHKERRRVQSNTTVPDV